jgi:hypothetical protein
VKKEKDPTERVEFGRHWGDWGGIVMAVILLIGFLAFLFGSNPLEGLDKADQVINRIQKENIAKAERAEKAQEQAQFKALHDEEASGVVTVGIAPPKKH